MKLSRVFDIYSQSKQKLRVNEEKTSKSMLRPGIQRCRDIDLDLRGLISYIKLILSSLIKINVNFLQGLSNAITTIN